MNPSTWSAPSAVLVSHNSSSYMLLRELLRPMGWSVHSVTDSVTEVSRLARMGEVSLVIILDQIELPASYIARRLLSDPFGRTLPVLAFFLQHHIFEEKALKSMLSSGVVLPMPLTPARFHPAFKSLIQMWDVKPYLNLRQMMYQNWKPRNYDQIEAVFLKFIKEQVLLDIIVPPYAALLRRKNQFATAEKLLLQCVSQNPSHLGLLIVLGEHYIKAGSPEVALKLFKNAFVSFNHTTAVLFDLVQCLLVLGELSKAQELLLTLLNRGVQTESCAVAQAKIFFAQGRSTEAERSLMAVDGVYSRMKRSWNWKS
ncbi:MAG: tetratricopeptide repeat protein [Oligoflexales bacterium]